MECESKWHSYNDDKLPGDKSVSPMMHHFVTDISSESMKLWQSTSAFNVDWPNKTLWEYQTLRNFVYQNWKEFTIRHSVLVGILPLVWICIYEKTVFFDVEGTMVFSFTYDHPTVLLEYTGTIFQSYIFLFQISGGFVFREHMPESTITMIQFWLSSQISNSIIEIPPSFTAAHTL